MLIHIGYHKTATSWLQQCYFAKHPDYAFLDDPSGIGAALVLPHDLDFNPRQARGYFDPAIEQARRDGRTPVISFERLSGNPHAGGYDSKVLADRLRATFPDARILIVIRAQVEAIGSLYRQYVRIGGLCNLAEYLNPPRDYKLPLFRLEQLCYDRLAEYYVRVFGSERVCLLPYEQFRATPEAFLGAIAAFAGVSVGGEFPVEQRVNRGLSGPALELWRWANRYDGGVSVHPLRPRAPRLAERLKRLATWLDARAIGHRAPERLRELIAEQVGGFYRDSNRRLEQRFALGLARYGYDL